MSYSPTSQHHNRGSTHDSYADHYRGDQSHASRYLDRDDPRLDQAYATRSLSEQQFRSRSRSPPVYANSSFREQSNQPAPSWSNSAEPVRWKDLRLTGKNHTATVPSSAAFSAKIPASKYATTAANKRMATDISTWNRKQAELHADEPLDMPASVQSDEPATSWSSTAKSLGKADDPQLSPAPRSSSKVGDQTLSDLTKMSQADLTSYDYRDLPRIACLLCQRKFKSVDTLDRHQAESQLHKHNLANPKTCTEGVIRKLETHRDTCCTPKNAEQNIAAPHIAGTTTAALTYRDRASERRAVFGANTCVKFSNIGNAQRVFEGPKPTNVLSNTVEEAPQSAPEKPIDSHNIGSKLLAMMGWTQGQGLGLNGQGSSNIVQTKIYKPRAGLGSSAPTETATHEASLYRKPGANVAFTGYLDLAKDRECFFRPEFVLHVNGSVI
uniref:Related to RNA binding motif protein n=1 Tax=Melanopsichium pennsylvanicum 4 TaxID=1398559 RepID=A0A077R8Q7_9BASI|nr:related to RNA binding motif protein [Melanopsichium pennsylvanicum 4]